MLQWSLEIVLVLVCALRVRQTSAGMKDGYFSRDAIWDCLSDQYNASFWPGSTTVCAFHELYKCRGYHYPAPYPHLSVGRNVIFQCSETEDVNSINLSMGVDGTHVFYLTKAEGTNRQLVIDVDVQAQTRRGRVSVGVRRLSPETSPATVNAEQRVSAGGDGVSGEPRVLVMGSDVALGKGSVFHPLTRALMASEWGRRGALLVATPLTDAEGYTRESDSGTLYLSHSQGDRLPVFIFDRAVLAGGAEEGEEGELSAVVKQVLSASHWRDVPEAVRKRLRPLLDILASYDVLVYADDYWDTHPPRPPFSTEQVLVHVAWLIGRPLVRYLSSVALYRDIVHDHRLPADGYLFESSSVMHFGTIQLQMNGPKYSHRSRPGHPRGESSQSKHTPAAILPPCVTRSQEMYQAFLGSSGFRANSNDGGKDAMDWPHYHRRRTSGEGSTSELVLIHAGGARVDACPGAFVKIAKLLMDVDTSTRSGERNRGVQWRFVMLKDGYLGEAMEQYVQEMGMSAHFELVSLADVNCSALAEDPSPSTSRAHSSSPVSRTFDSDLCLMRHIARADVLLDSCSTTAGNAVAYPLALMAGTPIVGMSSVASIEWLEETQGVFVEVGEGGEEETEGEGKDDIDDGITALVEYLMGLKGRADAGGEGCGSQGYLCFGNLTEGARRAERYFSQHPSTRLIPALAAAHAVLSDVADRGRGSMRAKETKIDEGGIDDHVLSSMPSPRAMPVPLSAVCPQKDDDKGDGELCTGVMPPSTLFHLPTLRALVADSEVITPVNVPLQAFDTTALKRVQAPPEQVGGGKSFVLSDSDTRALSAMRSHGVTTTMMTRTTISASGSGLGLGSDEPTLTLFGGVFTHSASRHSGQLHAVRDTWGRECDGFLAFSDENHEPTGSVALSLPQGPQHYYNMWQKTRAIWSYLGAHHVHPRHFQGLPLAPPRPAVGSTPPRYDWFVLGGDDMYVDVRRMRAYLNSPTIVSAATAGPVYLGRPLRATHLLVYNTGGPGYVLNARGVALLYNLLQTEACLPDMRSSLEDLFLAGCLAQVNVRAADTRDAQGRERFHWHAPGVEWDAVNAAYLHQAAPERAGIPIRAGNLSMSPESVALHDIKPAAYMRAVHSFLYD